MADEAHQLNCSPKGLQGTALEKQCAFMQLLGSIRATQGHWCLSGTPLKNHKKVQVRITAVPFLFETHLSPEELGTSCNWCLIGAGPAGCLRQSVSIHRLGRVQARVMCCSQKAQHVSNV